MSAIIIKASDVGMAGWYREKEFPGLDELTLSQVYETGWFLDVALEAVEKIYGTRPLFEWAGRCVGRVKHLLTDPRAVHALGVARNAGSSAEEMELARKEATGAAIRADFSNLVNTALGGVVDPLCHLNATEAVKWLLEGRFDEAVRESAIALLRERGVERGEAEKAFWKEERKRQADLLVKCLPNSEDHEVDAE